MAPNVRNRKDNATGPERPAAQGAPARRAVLVLGMHRAGTSALARVLSLRGASLPAHVLPANPGNPSGYWEPERIVALNDAMLDYFGVQWDDPFAAWQLPPSASFPAKFQAEAGEILAQEFAGADLFVLKDPRCTLLQGFWRDALAAAGADVCPVVIMRPFAEVAESLVRRDGTSTAGAALLYIAYGLEAARAVGDGATVVTYAQLLADWRGATDRIATEQGFAWPVSGARMSNAIQAFLRPPSAPPRAPQLPDTLARWTHEVWTWFDEAAHGRPLPATALDAVRNELQSAMAVFAPVLADRARHAQELAEEAGQARQQAQHVAALLDESQATLAHTARERDALMGERDRVMQVQQQTEHDLQQLQQQAEQQLQELRAQAARDAQQVREQSERELQQARAEAEQALQQAGQALQQARAEAEQALQQVRAEAEQALQQARAQAEQERQQFQAQAQDHDRQQLETSAALSTAMHRALQLQARTNELERLLPQATAERDALSSQRDDALRIHRQTEGELQRTQGLYQQLEQQHREAVAALSAVQQQTEAELVRTQDSYRRLDEAAGALRALVEQLEQNLHEHKKREGELSNGLAAAREELADAQATIARLGGERDEYQRELERIHGSRSWRMTSPLRDAARLGRRLLVRPGSMLLLTGPSADEPPARVVPPRPPVSPPAAPARGAEPAFEARPHAGLRAFLVEEFGGHAADGIVERIDRYRLPIPTDEVRAASATGCSEADALAWAAAIARRASHRIDPAVVPEVSIVVPVYNQVAFTLACIDALVAHQTRHPFEILIGDDASGDATAAALATPINGVRHVRHGVNLGFVRNCNATAALARGHYVVFLNNDTQVLPGWLDELVGTLQREPGVGLAGSKLVYPDGRLQECGGIVWRDGSAWNFGRLDDPRRPEYCYLRDTDYVSGASIALPRALWAELGGFDELFVPAYAEDVDLAFRVRARGLRTVVQPLSQLLHFEGISSGTDLGQGAKAYQVENLRKLQARWQGVLATHRENADHPELEKERGVAKRMLFVDLVTPTPNEDAGSLVAYEMMTAFRDSGFKITFIPEDNFAHMGESTRDLQRAGIEAIYHPAYSSIPAFLAARNDPFDVILLVRFRVGEAHLKALRERYPHAKIIFSNCDLHYLREMREAELSGDAAAMAAARETKRRETAVIGGADLNLVHSEAELELLRKDVPSAPTVLFPLVHDPVPHCPSLEQREGTCFIGGYRHAPNADGIRWFAEKIWPLVRERLPDEKLYIAGSSMTDEVRALAAHPNVEVVGFVEDLGGFLAKRRAAIAPLRFGAGAKGKVAASLAHGVPVVSTFVGAEGMQLTPGANVLVADDEAGFAASLVEVLSSDRLWRQLSAAGLAYAAEVTSRAAARRRVQSIREQLGIP